jgi:predicted NBD/HSP70 family sugar kinase
MIDPEMISIGGGVSRGFDFFKNSMSKTLEEFSPSYSKNNIYIFESKHKELSSQLGAALLLLIKQRP